MRRSWLLVLLLTSGEAYPRPSVRRYIIVLHPSTPVDRHLSTLGLHSFDIQVSHRYTFVGFTAYAAALSPSTASSIRQSPSTLSLELDRPWIRSGSTNASAAALVRQSTTSWGLHALSHRRRSNPDKAYIHDDSAGAGTYAYTLDDGIYTAHRCFGRRAVKGYNAIPSVPFADAVGHGTMVAGLIGGEGWGVAQACTLVAVKVISGEETNTAVVLDGYAWAVGQFVKRNRQSKAMVNISLNGPPSEAIDAAIEAARRKGVTTVVSAGNEGADAGRRSPSRAAGAICVSAVDEVYRRPQQANHGPVVKMFAPGVNVDSAFIDGPEETASGSGISYASAYVAGLVLYGKALKTLKDDRATRKWLFGAALKNYVVDPRGSVSMFAYNGNGA